MDKFGSLLMVEHICTWYDLIFASKSAPPVYLCMAAIAIAGAIDRCITKPLSAGYQPRPSLLSRCI